MLTSWSRAIFTEGWASIISSANGRQAASEEGKVWSISHHSPILVFIYLKHLTVGPQQRRRSDWYRTASVASLNRPIPVLNIGSNCTSFCVHLRVHSREIQTDESLMTLQRANTWIKYFINNTCTGDTWTWAFCPGRLHLNDITQIRRRNNTSTMK